MVLVHLEYLGNKAGELKRQAANALAKLVLLLRISSDMVEGTGKYSKYGKGNFYSQL